MSPRRRGAGPRLSAIPAERALQQSMIVLLGTFGLLLLAWLALGASSFAAVGTSPELQTEREQWLADHGLDTLRAVGAVVMPVAVLAVAAVGWWRRREVATTTGLKSRWVMAAVIGSVLCALWSNGPAGIAAIAVTVVATLALPRAPAAEHTERIEGGSFD